MFFNTELGRNVSFTEDLGVSIVFFNTEVGRNGSYTEEWFKFSVTTRFCVEKDVVEEKGFKNKDYSQMFFVRENASLS